jgi:hypothetical protein
MLRKMVDCLGISMLLIFAGAIAHHFAAVFKVPQPEAG